MPTPDARCSVGTAVSIRWIGWREVKSSLSERESECVFAATTDWKVPLLLGDAWMTLATWAPVVEFLVFPRCWVVWSSKLEAWLVNTVILLYCSRGWLVMSYIIPELRQNTRDGQKYMGLDPPAELSISPSEYHGRWKDTTLHSYQ